jgi:hypothetical protein
VDVSSNRYGFVLTAYSDEVEHPFRRKVNAFLPLSIG